MVRISLKTFLLGIILGGMVNPLVVFATMNSTNYQIWADSVSSGGNRSSSANFIVNDTISEAATSENQSSTNFFASAGLPAIFEEPALTASLSSNNVTLSGSITPTSLVTASYTLTVSTSAPFGYSAQVIEDANFRFGGFDIDDVSDGSVTAGVEEYGIAVSGTDAAFADDRALSTSVLTVASRSNWTTGTVSTITHKAAASASTRNGAYSHTVTYIITGNF